jgi:hypothetical protein
VSDALKAMGYTISVEENMGDVNAIHIDPATGKITGSQDMRRYTW